ncbi:MAG: hypothetical protein AAF805_00425 [Planctomycetota bacterium]
MSDPNESPKNDGARRVDGAQADHLRRVADRVAGHAADAPAPFDRTVVLFGAKGGVGVSVATLAVASDLAAAAERSSGKVLAVDAHWGRDDLSILARQRTDSAVRLTTAANLGATRQTGQAAQSAAARRLLSATRRWAPEDTDWVVVDAGVIDDAWGLGLAQRASKPLLVTTPDDLSIVNAFRQLKRLGPTAGRVGVVVNHCPDADAAASIVERIAASCRAFLGAAPALAGWMPTSLADPAAESVRSAA